MSANCVECGAVAEEFHHVVPKSVGGTFTVPLCSCCHGKVHGLSGREGHNELTKRGLDKKNVEELAAAWAHVCVLGMTARDASEELDIPLARLRRRVSRVREMDDSWRKELFMPIVGKTQFVQFTQDGK